MRSFYSHCLLLKAIAISMLFWLSSYQLKGQAYLEIIKNSKSKTFREIIFEVESYYKDRDKGKGSGYKQFKRWEYLYRTRIRQDETLNEYTHQQYELYNTFKRDERRDARIGGPVSNGNWKPMGPNSGNYQNYNGRINTILVDPANSKIIYAGSPAGGLWRSVDNGINWKCLTDNILSNIGITSIVIDPQSPASNRTIYILTGDKDAFNTSYIGIFKSIDNGASWVKLNYDWPAMGGFYKLMIHPANNKLLFMLNDVGVFQYKVDLNSWELKLSGDFTDMEFKPFSPSVIYVSGSTGTYRSTNTGNTWQKVSSPIPTSRRNELAVSPANSAIVYLLVGENAVASLYKSSDSGTTFNKVATSFDFKSFTKQYLYDLAIAVSPADANKLYIAAVHIHQSSDGGLTWSNDYMGHVDYHLLDFFQGYLYCSNDGGITRRAISTPRLGGWEDLSNNFSVSQLYRLGTDERNASHILIGTQDNGTHTVNGTTSKLLQDGDGMECFIDPVAADVWYTSLQYGQLFRGGPTLNFKNITPSVQEKLWLTPFKMDPLNHNVIYVGYADLWKNTYRGDNPWINITNGAAGKDLIEDFAISPSDPNYIYLYKWTADGTGKLYRTTNGGKSWSLAHYPDNTFINSIIVHPKDPNTLWVATGGYNSGGPILKSTNGGTAWTNVSGSLPAIPAQRLVYHKGTANGIYIGTDLGVFYKDDAMTDWIKFDYGMPYAPITDLEINHATGNIYAGTYGRGAWVADLFRKISDNSACTGTGTIQREMWTNVTGTNVSSIPVNSPPSSKTSLKIFEIPANVGDNYGSRIRGFVCVPSSGAYTFWISSDDNSELWLSTDDKPANKKKIATVNGATGRRQWDKYITQQSVSVTLQAGRKYYIETLHKESTGADHLAVGWRLPDGTLERPIPGSRLIEFEKSSANTSPGAKVGDQSISEKSDSIVMDFSEDSNVIQVFPNPANQGMITVMIDIKNGTEGMDDRAYLEISTFTGAKVYSDNVRCELGCRTEITLNENFKPGIYLIKITINGSVFSEKFVVR